MPSPSPRRDDRPHRGRCPRSSAPLERSNPMTELTILEDSLKKKKKVLSDIIKENESQESALKAEPVSFDDFEAIVDKKTGLIEELVKLDQGFESVYDRIREQLLTNREQYKQKIESLKLLITEITELSVSIQAQEGRNKVLVEKVLKQSKDDLKTDRIRAKAAYDFMSRQARDVPARFMDTKK